MKNSIEELMEKSVISENKDLSQMISDIVPLKEKLFTNLEIETTKKQEFSLIVYKKENVLVRFIKNIKLSIEKLRIIRHSKEFEMQKITNFEIKS